MSITVIGLILALATLVVLSYKSWGMLPATIVASLVVIITNRMDLWESFSVHYANSMKNFAGAYIILFFLSTFFGGIMGESGAAKSIATKLMKTVGKDKGILIVVLASAILSYGGVSLFVIVFAIYPIALVLFQEGNISKNLFPAALFLGVGTFTMVNLPGSPAITNIIPTSYFGTTAYAAPVIGIASGIVVFLVGYNYLKWEQSRLDKKGIGFTPGITDDMTAITIDEDENLPSWILATIPMVVIVALVFILRGRVNATFSVIIAISAGLALSLLFFWNRVDNILKVANQSGSNSILALLNTAAVVGFGGVVSNSPAFVNVVDYALSLRMSPLISSSVAVNIVAGVTGSSSGGLTIFMQALGAEYLQMAKDAGINPQVLHRITAIAGSGLDSLPHCGAIITANVVTGLTHKESYKYIVGTNIITPLIGLTVAIILATIGLV